MRINLERARERGMAVIVVIMLVGIILIYVAANLRSLELLRRDLKLVEQHQIRRTASQVHTNQQPAAANVRIENDGAVK